VLLKVDGAAAAEGADCAVVASAAPKSFSVKVFPSIMLPYVFSVPHSITGYEEKEARSEGGLIRGLGDGSSERVSW
jgi:hypothetical protein